VKDKFIDVPEYFSQHPELDNIFEYSTNCSFYPTVKNG